jgi:hypothetical protein
MQQNTYSVVKGAHSLIHTRDWGAPLKFRSFVGGISNLERFGLFSGFMQPLEIQYLGGAILNEEIFDISDIPGERKKYTRGLSYAALEAV